MKNKTFQRGFTLIELLIVIAVVGVLSAGVITSINIVSKINSANIAKSETFDASIQNSLSINLVGEWTFSGNANDTSGYNNNGTVTGAILTTDRKGQSNKAYNFDGISNKIVIGDQLDLIGSPISISAWVKPSTLAAFAAFVEKLAGGGNYRLIISSASGNFAFGIRNAAGGYEQVESIGTLQAGQWSHVVATFDNGTTGKLYLNGVLDNTRTTFTLTRGDTNNVLEFGFNQNNAVYYKGFLDDVRIYSQTLTSYSVQQLYAQGLKKHQLAKN